MKLALFVLLMGFCIMSGIAHGKKFVCENDTVQIENCETSDTNESDVSQLQTLLHSNSNQFQATHYFSLSMAWGGFLINPVSGIHLEFFTPPPEV